MLPYWFFFLVPVSFALVHGRRAWQERWSLGWLAMFAMLVLSIGLRHEVGGDWFGYVEHINAAADRTLWEALTRADPAYGLLTWIAAHTGQQAYFVNTISALIFTWGLLLFCRAQPDPWLALVVAMPYLVTVVAMGYTRQAVAIGLVMAGLVSISERRFAHFFILVALAACFHRSAVIMIPLAILGGRKRKLWTVVWVVGVSALLYYLLLQETLDELRMNYIEAQYASSGATARVAMNAVPAAVFLLFRRHFAMTPDDRAFWTWMAVGGLLFVLLLLISPSSTAVDRLALYWIPLQLCILSRIPAVFLVRGGTGVAKGVVIAYSAAALGVWLVYADHAHVWIPYQFYPLVGWP